jgi:AcrR family transcriptional regulator
MTNGDGASSSRDVILAAARDLVSSRGYDGMLMSELSARSGLPASSIYYHFGSKLGVLGALLERTFEELHASFPSPSSFDGHEPIERFELWFTAACSALDQRPDYLRLLLAVSAGSHVDIDPVRDIVRRIRAYAHASWTDALTPIFGAAGGDPDDGFVDQLAVIGRAMTDGLSVGTSFEGTTHSAQVAPFVALIRSAAAQRARTR